MDIIVLGEKKMAEDLKLEIRKLFALHEATLRLEHAFREVALSGSTWQVFTPSRFIYAFFTFNSIYGFDWQSSFDEQKVIRWQQNDKGRYPTEEEQFKAYFGYVNAQLSPDTPTIFSEKLNQMLDWFGITDPVTALEHIDLVNANKKLKKLSKKVPNQFSVVLKGDQNPDEFYLSVSILLEFVYKVRCNLFHGTKTMVQLLNMEQQKRLLIYTALLITTNSLLFRVTEKSNIGWVKVSVEFSPSKGN